jgi:hypothetical protein
MTDDDDLIHRIRRATEPQGAPVPDLGDVLRAARRRRTWPAIARAAALLLAALAGAAADHALVRHGDPVQPRSPQPEARQPDMASVRQAVAARPGGLAASLAVLASFDGKH